MTKKDRKTVDRLVAALVAAEVEKSWIGSRCPESHGEIEDALEAARTALTAVLDRLTETADATR